jgi:hypothetical protein
LPKQTANNVALLISGVSLLFDVQYEHAPCMHTAHWGLGPGAAGNVNMTGRVDQDPKEGPFTCGLSVPLWVLL